MRLRALKAEVGRLLDDYDLPALAAVLQEQEKQFPRYLFPFLVSGEELIRHRAAEALGLVCKELAVKDPEFVLDILRRLRWMVNDESGGIGWGAIPAMAEIVRYLPEQFGTYGTIAVSQLDEPALQPSSLWAAGLLARVRPEFIEYVVPQVALFLSSPDPTRRGYAARALAAGGFAVPALAELREDQTPVRVYEDGQMRTKTVAELAAAR